jgi:quinol monooxygenase YgiN
MYGTIAFMKIKPGNDERLKAYAEGPGSEPIPGAVASYVYRLDGAEGTYAVAAVFESEAAYRANASSPEQHQRYAQLRELLAADPEWHDGRVVFTAGAART